MKVNFKQAEKAFSPVPLGTYDAMLTAKKYKQDKKNQDVVTLTFTITEEPHQNRKVLKDYWLTEKALYFLKRDLITLGADPDAFGTDVDDDEDAEVDLDEVIDSVMGGACLVSVSVQESSKGDGRQFNSVEQVSSPDGF